MSVENKRTRGSKGLHTEQVKAAIRMKTGTIAAFAASHGLTPAAVTNVLQKTPQRSLRVERLIGELLGIPPEKIWPERYAKPTWSRSPKGRTA